MKCIGIAAALAALSFASCKQPTVENTANEERPAVPAVAPPAGASTAPPAPTAPPVAAQPAVPPVPPKLAPEGVFFLTQAVSIETSDGIAALPRGTQVVRQPDGSFIGAGHSVKLRAEQITNDLALAARLANSEAAAQAAIRQAIVLRTAATPTAATTVPSAASGPSLQPRTPPPSSVGRPGATSLENPKKDRTGVDTLGRHYWIDSSGKRHYE